MYDVYASLSNEVAKAKVLNQEDMYLVFAKCRHLVNDCLVAIASCSEYPQHSLLNLASYVISGVNNNKSIYKKTSAVLEGVDVIKLDFETSKNFFVNSAFDLACALSRKDVVAQQEILERVNIIRMCMENFIKEWLEILKDYCDTHNRLAHALVNNEADKVTVYRSQIDKMHAQSLCTAPDRVYGVYKYVYRRINALDDLHGMVLKSYSKFILKTAKGSAGSEAQRTDSFQNGCLGMLRAISSYDHCSYVAFINFSRWWVIQSIMHFLKEEANTIKIPVSVWQKYTQMEREKEAEEVKSGKISNEEFADRRGYEKSKVTEILSTSNAISPKSVDMPKTYNGDSPGFDPVLFSMLVENTLDQYHEYGYNQTQAEKYWDELNYNERLVLSLQYGMLEMIPEKQVSSKKVEKYLQLELERQSQ